MNWGFGAQGLVNILDIHLVIGAEQKQEWMLSVFSFLKALEDRKTTHFLSHHMNAETTGFEEVSDICWIGKDTC